MGKLNIYLKLKIRLAFYRQFIKDNDLIKLYKEYKSKHWKAFQITNNKEK